MPVPSRSFRIVKHQANVMGYSIFAVLPVFVLFVLASNFVVTAWRSSAVPVFNPFPYWMSTILPMHFGFTVLWTTNTAWYPMYDGELFAGLRVSLLVTLPSMLLSGVFVFLIAFVVIPGAGLRIEDLHFHFVDLVGVFVAIIMGIVVDVKLRSNASFLRVIGAVSDATMVIVMAQSQPTDAHSDEEEALVSAEQSPDSNDAKGTVLITLLTAAAQASALFIYPIYFIPVYSSAYFSDATRLVFCLLVHPSMLEAILHTQRDSGMIWPDKRMTFEFTYGTIIIEAIFILERRFMLSMMDNPTLTTIGIIVTCIEETLLRSTVVERDLRFQKKKLTKDRMTANTVWMVQSNNSMIVEICAIFIRSMCVILFLPERYVFNLGYGKSEEHGIQSMIVFFNLFLEIIGELVVDHIALVSELENGVPVDEFFDRMPSSKFLLHHIGALSCATGFTLFTFSRIPTSSFCDNTNPCSCLNWDVDNAESNFEIYRDACLGTCNNDTATAALLSICDSPNYTTAVVFNMTQAENRFVTNPTSNSGNLIYEVLVALGSLVTAVALVFASLQCAARRKQKGRILQMEIELEDKNVAIDKMQQSLDEAQKIIDKVMKEGGSMLDRFKIKHSEISFGVIIGQGSFGDVFEATIQGKKVAVKTLRTTKVSEKVLKEFMKEITMMSSVSHPHIVHLVGGCWEDGPDNLSIILEFCPSSLDKLMRRAAVEADLTWESIFWERILELSHSLNYLHHGNIGVRHRPVMHRDLKPENILISSDGVVKVADFGEARYFDVETANSKRGSATFGLLTMTSVGTPTYCAPEVIQGNAYNQSVDTYAFGIILLEVISTSMVRDHRFVRKQFAAAGMLMVVQGWRPGPPKNLRSKYPEVLSLIEESWSSEINSRPDFTEVVQRVEGFNANNNFMRKTSDGSVPMCDNGGEGDQGVGAFENAGTEAAASHEGQLGSNGQRLSLVFPLTPISPVITDELQGKTKSELISQIQRERTLRTLALSHAVVRIENPECEVEVRILDDFKQVKSPEVAAVRWLFVASVNQELLKMSHAFGAIACLRIIRECPHDSDDKVYQWIRDRVEKMIHARRSHSCDAKCREIVERGLSLHNLPGHESLVNIGFRFNSWVGVDRFGDIVGYQRWGGMDPKKLVQTLPLSEMHDVLQYREEARAMVLDTLSRRNLRVISYSFIIDASGVNAGHRNAMAYFQTCIRSSASLPPTRSVTFVLKCGPISLNLLSLAKRLNFINEKSMKTVHFIKSTRKSFSNAMKIDNPFTLSADFAERFGKEVLPIVHGGTLTIGDDDHCCTGVQLPGLNDADALHAQYDSFSRGRTAGAESKSQSYKRRVAKKKSSLASALGLARSFR